MAEMFDQQTQDGMPENCFGEEENTIKSLCARAKDKGFRAWKPRFGCRGGETVIDEAVIFNVVLMNLRVGETNRYRSDRYLLFQQWTGSGCRNALE
jgi:hypothetical protein